MKTFILTTFLLFIFWPPLYGQHNVLYGERGLQAAKPAVYFDKEGSIYPDYFIADSSLQNCNASLSSWFQSHPDDFINVSRLYNCAINNYSLDNFQLLQDSIYATIKHTLNKKKNDNTSLSFLIHGFRKAFVQTNKDLTSTINFQTLETSLLKFNTASTCFVEVYWDGLYDCCYSANSKKNKKLFRLLVAAQGNAVKVGKGFRKLLDGITFDKINIITHSLGAEIATVALFDKEEPGPPTPTNKTINLCLIAPAIAGTTVFQYYHKRNSLLDHTNNDNYRLLILYNEKDFVLRKKDNVVGIFGPGPYKYINTTLGCNYKHEAEKLESYFKTNYPLSVIKNIDLSAIGKCHHIKCYCEGDNLEGLVKFINE